MKARDIRIGGYYLNKLGTVREVIGLDGRQVVWRDYDSEGRPIGGGAGSKARLARWAERLATEAEIQRLRTSDVASAE